MGSEKITRLIEVTKTTSEDSPEYKEAVAELREWNAENAKLANSRMRSLERGDMRRYAYNRAINFTESMYGTGSFKGGRATSLSDQDLIDQVQEIDTFLGRKTSSLRFAKEMERARGEYLTETLGIEVKSIARRIGVKPKSAITAFYRFLGTETVASFLKDVSGYYKVVLEGVATVIASSDDKKATVDRLVDSIEDYLAGAKRYDTLLAELGVSIDDLSDTAKIY
jgi:hypothetical protein